MIVKIPNLGVEEDDKCTIEATVVTGFEFLASQEIKRKLGSACDVSRGRVVFQVPIEDITKVTELKSIDNVYVVIYNNNNEVEVTAEKDVCLERLVSVVPSCWWDKGLKVWSAIFSKGPEEDLKFRVTCNRASGSAEKKSAHSFTSPEAATKFGGAVQDKFKWKADMTKFDVEVVLNVVDCQTYVCLSLTKESLHHRNIVDFAWTTLRSTVAYNLLQLADIRDGDVVCDPMCGSGAIPIEAALNWTGSVHLCGDIHPGAVAKTLGNRNHLKNKQKILDLDVYRWDITRLPLKTNSVDVFVTDLPFGRRSGSKMDNRLLYPRLLNEMARASRVDRGRAVLLTQDKRTMGGALQKTAQMWKPVKSLTINLGGLLAGVYLLERKSSQGKPPPAEPATAVTCEESVPNRNE